MDGIGDFILRKSLPVGTYQVGAFPPQAPHTTTARATPSSPPPHLPFALFFLSQYKFVVDGRWRVSPDDTVVRDSRGELNNQVTVAADATVTIFYKTGWSNPRLVVVDTTQPGALPLKLPKANGNGNGNGNGAEVEQSPYEEARGGEKQSPCPRCTDAPLHSAPLLSPASSDGLTTLVGSRRRVTHSFGAATERLMRPPAVSFTLAPSGAVLVPPKGPLEERVAPSLRRLHRQRGRERDVRARADPGGGGGIRLASRGEGAPRPRAHPPTARSILLSPLLSLHPLCRANHRALPPSHPHQATSAPTALPRPIAQKSALEFIVTDGKGLYDLAPGGGTYNCPWPGGYKLENGRLMAFPRAKTPPIMLVSDLDGTMVGQSPEFDAATRAFKRYWDDSASLAGSVLVYSTGRSIGQVMSLFKEKQGALAVPDAIVSAVGTKIFLREAGAVEGEWCWREDLEWKAQLDKGWDLVPVKAACQAVINAHDGRVQWLDQGTEHPHRVAVSVASEAVEAVQARLAALFASAGVEVKIIVSGEGAWRYVDCVAALGGKQESLEYLRRHYMIPLERTVAAGDRRGHLLAGPAHSCASCCELDVRCSCNSLHLPRPLNSYWPCRPSAEIYSRSGNDILMLGGKHQALIVGNAQPDLLTWHLLQPQTGRCVLTDAHGADGILEGLARLQLY